MEQLSRKKRRQLERQNGYKNRHPRKQRKSLMIFVIIAVVGGGLFWLISSAEKTPELGETFPDQGRAHIAADAQHAIYNSNPPTSGPHADSIGWGIYDTEQLDTRLIHNIEHGGIWISYKDITAAELAELQNIARRHPGSVVLTPRSQNDDRIAVASWRRLMRLEVVDVDKIETYIRKYKNRSPERLAY